ncbi:MAG TPA: GDSL-type esterase/lipase family protein [Kofleriaceae bacterium]|nr:GDSL-type esterase/lipase family protein [Kofleriaceae bacterium]
MSARDRSWTVGPALLWFSGCLIAALWLFDGGIGAIADRFTAARVAQAAPTPAAGPTFAAKSVATAEASGPRAGAEIAEPDEVKPAIVTTARDKVGALEDTCLDGTPERCKKWAMDGFYRAYGEARAKKLGHALRVSWYGDSVIATDAIPGHLRTLLQAELGDGGPGFVFAQPPHRFCGHDAIVRGSTGTWSTHAITTLQVADGLYGVGGSTTDTDDGRVSIKLVAGTASRAELYFLAQPHGGTATITADGKPIATAQTAGDRKEPGWASGAIEGGAKKFDVAASGRVRLFGLALENDTGATVDNLGVVSVNVKSFNANNPEHFTAEVAHRGADLVMIMIGANEAQWLGPTDHDTQTYAEHYGKMLALVRKARPDGSCLVVSPTDQAEAKDGDYPSRPVMPVLVAAQRAAAQQNGCGFFSTYAWMGGKGSAVKWFRTGLVGTDFQHLSRKGANRLSEAVYATLKAGYDNYAKH